METVTVRMARGDRNQSWGFGVTEAPNRDVVIVNIVGGSLADRAGLRNGDILYALEGLRDLDINAVDRLLVTSRDKIELVLHRSSGGQTRIWRPEITENPEMRAVFSGNPPPVDQRPYKVSLEHRNEQRAPQGFNSAAMPFETDPRVKHLQYNSPMGIYSQQNVVESYRQQTAGLESNQVPSQGNESQPAYLRSETLRLLKEQESARSAPSLSSHPNPSGLPVCFVCTRPILGVMAQAAGHTIHGDCLSCATCGNSLRNVGHHFIDNKFYCEIHGRQKRGLGGVSLDPNLAVRSSPTAVQPKRVEEGVRAFYQPEVLSRRAVSPQPPQVNVHVGTPKTQGPISPSNRGVPHGVAYDDRRHYEERRPVSPRPLATIIAPPPTTIPAPAPPPTQAPPPPPSNPPPGISVSVDRPASSLSVVPPVSESRVPSSVRDAVSPRRAVRAPRPWPPPATPVTNRYWQIDPAGQIRQQRESQPFSLQEMIEMDEKEERKAIRGKRTAENGKHIQKKEEISQECAATSEIQIKLTKPEITSGIHWTIVTGPKSPERPNVTKIRVEHVEEKRPHVNALEKIEAERPTELPKGLRVEAPERVDSSTSPIPVIRLERQKSTERRLPCTSSPTPFQAPTVDLRPPTPPIIRIEGQSPIPCSASLGEGCLVGINTPPRPFGSCLKKEKTTKRVDFSKTEIIPSPVYETEIIDESDMLTETSRHSDDSSEEGPRISYDGDKSEDEEEDDLLDEQDRWMREELELAMKEELEMKKLEERWKESEQNAEEEENQKEALEEESETQEEASDDWRKQAEALLNEDEQNERDLEVVAALHERLSGLREMEDGDRQRAIECIERHQRSLEEQQEQLSQLLQSAIQYLRTMEPVEPTLPLKPPTPPPRKESIVKTDCLNDALEELEMIRLPITPADKVAEGLRRASPQMFTRSTFDKTIESSQKTNGVRTGGVSGVTHGTTSSLGGRIPYCEACKQQIKGAFVLATGLTWCPEHFVCANRSCGRRLLECGFVEENGQKYCEGCFESHIAPRCAKCAKPITSDCLNALQKKWHPTCFTCAHCHKPFGNSAFYLENGQAYCEQDWNQLFTTKCVSCKYPIEAGDRWVEALGSAFHSNCFNCTRCHTNLEGESFYAKNGQPYCKMHA